MIYNVIWKGQPRYTQCSEVEMLEHSLTKKEFRCFQFKDKARSIRMITIQDRQIIKGEW